MLRNLLPLALVAFFVSACGLFDKEETIPAYVEVDRFELADTLGRPLSDFEITEVWAYLDGKYIGTFGLPAKFPVPVQPGNQRRLQLYPGVQADRVQQQRVQYPFYNADTSLAGLEPGKTYQVNLSKVARSRWGRQLRQPFRLEENFESGNTTFRRGFTGPLLDPAYHANHPEVTPPPDGGSRYGEVRFSGLEAKEILNLVQDTPTPLLDLLQIQPHYLECRYRSTKTMAVGIYASRRGNIAAGKPYLQLILNASPTWKKVYISLYDEARQAAQLEYDQFQVLFTSDSASSASDFIAVDNLRLMEYRP